MHGYVPSCTHTGRGEPPRGKANQSPTNGQCGQRLVSHSRRVESERSNSIFQNRQDHSVRSRFCHGRSSRAVRSAQSEEREAPMSKRADSGPLRRRRPPACPYKRDARKRGSANSKLGSPGDKCKRFALSGDRDICLALAGFCAEELADWLADRRWRWREL
jgi:hypothetical protein